MDPFDPRMPDNLDPTSADAEWKKIQQNTFTRWCNEHLKCVNQFIYNLETDLCDGLKLIALLQVLSHKKVPRHTKKPVFKSQKIENVSIALKFIEDQNIRLVNIDASDIVKGNLKLILGLIWTLILKYQISMPYMEEEEEGGTKMTPKQALLAWVKSKMPESVPMDNFSNHWNDGRAIACLVDAVAPGLLPECEDLDPKDSLENAQNAMKLAEDWLGVPQVLRPEDMINPKVDELSVMTYVSYFPEAKLKPGAPLKPRVHPSTKVTAKGPGVEPKGLVVNQPANFTVLSQGAGLGKLGVKVFSPSKEEVEVFVTDNGDHTYSCQYFPTTIGKYDVHVKWNGRHIPKSPFRVQVDSDLDAKKAYATGPGLEPSGIVAGKYTDFRVFTKGAGEGKVTVKVIDPRGGEDVDVIIEEQENSEYFVEYQPVNAGKHTIKVMFGGQPIKGSPFHVNVAPPRVEPVPGRVRVYGAGVEPTGLKAGYRAPFTVDAKGAGDGELDVIVEGPNGPEKVDIKSHADGTFSCVYFPQKFGKYVVTVTWSGVQVPNSPFNVKVSPAVDAKKIRAYGPGLESGVVGKPAHFTVETKGAGVDSLGFAIEGPSQAEIKCVDKGDGICDVTYFPTQPGKYAVHVTCGDDDIQNSPFMVPISPPGDASLCYAEGPGLEPEGVVTGAPAEFTVFTKQEPDQGDVEVEVVDSKGKKAPCQVTDNKDGTYSVVYHPTATGKYTITVTFNGKQIPKSPFKVNVCQTNSAKCKAYGPGLEKGFVGQSNDFKIETKGAGEGGLGLTIEGPSEAKIECKDNGDGSCDVHYWPTDPGDYNINILYADKHIPGSPFKAKIKYPFDASKVKVEGPGIEPGVRADEPADIDVDTRYAGEAELTVEVLDDLNKPVKVEVDDEEDGINPVAYYPKKQGPHKINIKYGGVHVPGSPFKVKVGPRSEPGKVKVAGPGIEPKGVKAGQPTWFTIDTEKAGKGDIHVGVEPDGRGAKPVEKITVTEESKDHYKCEYVAPVDGPYKVDVKFDGKPVQGSPYKIKVAKGHDASKCKAQGDGLESAIIDQLAEFDVDCSKAGDAPLTATMKNPSGAKTETLVTDNDDGTYAVSYTPVEEGPHTLDVKYGGDHIPGSPFKVNVQPPTDSTKCKAYGPGLEHAFVGKPADFTVETRGAGAGGLSLAVEGPSEAKLTCTDNGDGTCSVRYVPVEVGDYDIHIKFADEHIPGSPFTAKVTRPVDASKVKCYGPGIDKSAPLYSKAPQEFTVDTSEAGDAPLDVKVTPPTGPAREPEEIKQVGDGVYAVKYTPEDEGRYQVNVKYGDKEVPHSPFRVRVGPPYDASKVKVSGPGVEEAIVDEPAEFVCDCSEAGVAPLSATVTPPGGGNPVPCVIKEHGDGKYTCGWNPDVPGRHNVDVKYGDRRVPKSPFRVNVKPSGDASKVKVKGLGPDDRPIIGKENDFLVDARDAGKGKPTCTMKTPNKKEVPVEVLDNGDQTFTCKYVPTEEGRHPVDVKFGGDTVPGSPFYVKPKHGKDVSKIKCAPKDDQKPVVEEEVCYEVDAKPIESTPGEGIVTGALTTPDGDRVPVQVKNNKDGTYDVLSTPKQPGPHKLDVKYDDIPIPGSPFKYDAVEGGPDRVKCFGPGLEKGLVHEPCEFTVVTKSAGPGGLSLAIEGPSKAEITCTDNGDGSCNVKYVPDEPGDYHIIIKYADQHVPGSPFIAKIYSSPDELDSAKPRPTVGKPCDVGLDKIPERDRERIKASLKRPNKKDEEPLPLHFSDDGSPVVSFTPNEPGEHLIHLRKFGRDIENSPFSVLVGDQDEEIISPDIEEGVQAMPNFPEDDAGPKVGKPLDVAFDTPEEFSPRDLKNLTAALKRPNSKREEPVDVFLDKGKPVVTFTPKEPGKHLIHVRKYGRDIDNSPFTVMVGESEDEIRPTVSKPCDKPIDLPGVKTPEDLKKLKATIKRPSSDKEEPVDLSIGKDGSPIVKFTPRETGKHLLHVRDLRNREIPGSPFPIMVYDEDVMSQPKVGEPCDVILDLPDTDIENLEATLKRPHSDREEPIPLRLENGKPVVSFTPREPGKHLIHVRKFGFDIEKSPFTVMVGEEEDEIRPTVNRPCDAALDLPGVKSPEDLKKLKATIKRPSSDKEEPADLHMNKNGQPEVTFTPRETGMHMLHVRDNRGDIGGSPFPIMVGEEDVKSKPTSNQPCDVPLDIPDVKSPKDLEKLKATLVRPNSNREEPVDLRLGDDGSPIVSFTPTEPGKHLVHVRKYGRDVQNSPFTVMVQTPRLGDVYSVGHTCDVAIDAPGINLPEDLPKMTATLRRPGSNLEEPVKLKINPDNTLGVSFIPRQPGEYFLTVKKSGRQIPGSPFSILVEAEEPIEAVGCPVDYCFDIPEIDLNEDFDKLEATIKRPSSDKEEPIFLKHNSDDTLSCSFVPKEVGIHQINIRKFGRHVKGSPFAVKVTTPEAVSEVDRPYGMGLDIPGINLPDDFSLLSATLKRPSSPKEEELRLLLNGDNTLGVAFTPREVGEHLIHVRKNGIDVKGSPFSVMVVGKEKVEEVHPVGRTCDVGLNIPGVNLPEDFKKLTASLMRPSSKKEEPLNLELNPDNTLGLSFVPREQGEHKISVKKNREDVPGSPFSIMVEAAEAVNAVGKPCERTLDIPGIKPQDLPILKATLKRPSGDKEEPVKVKANSDNSLSVSFVPREQGEHFISVKKYGKHVRGSPFSVMVTEPEADNSIGRPCGVGLEIPGLKLPEDFNLLTGTLKRPNSSQEEPLKLILNSDNTLSVSFVPQETGEHLVSVMKNKQHVTGSPFSVMVSGPGPANPKKVKCYGPGLRTGVADKPAKFTVNTRDAGYGGLGLSIEGPSKAEINCVDNEDGTCDVDYLPTEPGKYTINVKFADEHVPGSPFTAMIKPQGSVVDEGIVPERTSEVFEDLVSFGSPEAQPHDFVFDLKGYDVKDLKVTVISPKGEILDSEILETGENTYTIRFIPKESGEYTVNVKHRGVHIPGSPFKVYVEAPAWGGASKCFAAGPGLERGVVGHPGQFTVWTRDAGPGGLAVAVEGPAKAEIQCKDNGDGSCDITYLPTAPGEYTIHIRFADENIPDSPYKVYVYPEVEDRFRDVNVSDLSETGLKVGQPASFSVQTNAPVGKVTASVIAPSGSETPATVADLGNGNFAIRFIPREFGDHLVNVRFDSSHIPGSPFKIRVGGAEGHPEKVKAYGPGLSSGTAGQPAEFTVNALEAGSGALALSVDGPAKVKMNCTENPDGTYQVTYHPVIAGDYTISIKFAGQHIPGSPYNVKIYPSSGKSPYSDGDASKCTSRGAGLTRAVIGQPNTFTVNASNAGRGSLMVGVEGPAIPAKEITVKHTGGNVYAVNYALEESGAYILKVLWADKHIPGSPFHVTV